MFERLFRIFNAENDRSQLIVLIVISVIIQLIFRGIGDGMVYSIIQLFVAWLIVFLIARFSDNEVKKSPWWKRIYVVVIVWSLVVYIFF